MSYTISYFSPYSLTPFCGRLSSSDVGRLIEK
jgi:hypothetical protein